MTYTIHTGTDTISGSDRRPRTGTRTTRRAIRQDIRNSLGTSHADAPTMFALRAAARQLDALMRLTTCGSYGISICSAADRHAAIPDDEYVREADRYVDA